MDEPDSLPGTPDTPEGLSEDAQDIWDSTIEHLRNMSLLSRSDGIIIETFARITSRWRKLESEIDDEGQYIKEPLRENNGVDLLYDIDNNIITMTVPNPRLHEARLLSQQVRAIASELGLSPVSRTKLSTQNKERPKSKMELLLKRVN